MPGTTIRPTTNGDCAGISALLAQAFAEFKELYTPGAYALTVITPQQMKERLQQGPSWVATHRGKVVGCVSVVRRPKGSYLRGMAVDTVFRGQRIGWRLLETIEQHARKEQSERLYLYTTPYLEAAIHLYEQFGFVRMQQPAPEFFGTPLFGMEKLTEKSRRVLSS